MREKDDGSEDDEAHVSQKDVKMEVIVNKEQETVSLDENVQSEKVVVDTNAENEENDVTLFYYSYVARDFDS